MRTISGFPVEGLVRLLDAMYNEGILTAVTGLNMSIAETIICEKGGEYLRFPPPEPPIIIEEIPEADLDEILEPLYRAKTKDKLKRVYRKLCKEYHSDKGGDGEIIKHINNAYSEMRSELVK